MNDSDLYKMYRLLMKPTPENLEQAYSLGLLKKDQLEDGKYYKGHCRNAEVAKWNAAEQKFTYMRYKFGVYFPEDILHPADFNGFDFFTPIAEAIPSTEEIIK